MPWLQDRDYPLPPRRREAARRLRRRLTEPEKRLWWRLRHRVALDGTHWRRQVPLATYVVDFCCLQHRLVIEVDGDQHGSDSGLIKDAERTRALEAQGFRVLRFSNREVMTSMDVVLDTILAAFGPAPLTPIGLRPTRPSPQGGGERNGAAA